MTAIAKTRASATVSAAIENAAGLAQGFFDAVTDHG
jgi:hypothetical protein